MGKGEKMMHKSETPRRVTQLTDRTAVEAAIAKCNELEREKFLKEYGFRHSTKFPLRHEGREYDSKAIAAVAFGIQHKTTPLKAKGGEIHGGIKPHEAGGVLMALGFVIVGTDGLPAAIKREIGDRVYVFRKNQPDPLEGWAIIRQLYLPNVEIEWEETRKTAVVTLSDLHEEDPYP